MIEELKYWLEQQIADCTRCIDDPKMDSIYWSAKAIAFTEMKIKLELLSH